MKNIMVLSKEGNEILDKESFLFSENLTLAHSKYVALYQLFSNASSLCYLSLKVIDKDHLENYLIVKLKNCGKF